MRHLDEGTIHSWLDGALSADEAARAEAHVASCTECAEAVAEARGLIAASTRILTALDDVPNVRSARGARGAGGRRFSIATWLVRERIAAVVAVLVAGGALAVAMSRDTPQASRVDLASELAETFELAAADSPAPLPAAAPEPPKAGQTLGGAGGRGAAASRPRMQDLAVARQADSAPVSMAQSMTETVTTQAAATPPARTDDSARSVAMAQAQREERRDFSAEGKAALNEERARVLPGRRAAPEASARFAEPRAAAPSIGNVVATGMAEDRRLLHDERMTEGGREVRRRIYSVDGILVTLDERLPSTVDAVKQAPMANAVPAVPVPPARDSAAGTTNSIRWTDARGAELTLTGPASQVRLERIRKLLGF